jgi:hypothetical protein
MTISSRTPDGEPNKLLVRFKRLRFINERIAQSEGSGVEKSLPLSADVIVSKLEAGNIPRRHVLNREYIEPVVEEVLGT